MSLSPSPRPSLPPLIVCGAPGSGTSLLARMLRHCGVFLGADAGPIDQRKYHESESFSATNRAWLDQLIGFPHAPKSVEQFQQLASTPSERVDQLVRSVDLEDLLQRFWSDHDRTVPWGWKDPRNSATAFIWQRLFPSAKIVVLTRKWSWRDRLRKEGSDSGLWYRHQSTRVIRRCYTAPQRIGKSELFTVRFERLIQDPMELNELLRKLGLSYLTIEDFDLFRRDCGVED